MSDNTFTNESLLGKVVVVGLGTTGLSVVRYLRDKNIDLAVVDNRDHPPGVEILRAKYSDIPVTFGEFDQRELATAKQLVVSPGLSLKTPAIHYASTQGVEVVGDIELFVRAVDKPVIAITGSNGKTTVTTLVGQIFESAGWKVGVGGNIGTPALDLLGQGYDIYVIELSSFQLETLFSLRASAAVVLNISDDHLDRYDSVTDYVAAKEKIYLNSKLSIVNRDDKTVSAMKLSTHSVGFGLGDVESNDYSLQNIDGSVWIVKNDQLVINTEQFKIKGLHNVSNVMAALALIEPFSLSADLVKEAIENFTGLPHRMQSVLTVDGINWINDSKATNVGATEAAINGLHGSIVLIAGGESKNADFTPLKQAVQSKVKAMVLMGRDAQLIERVCADVTDIHYADSMKEAVLKSRQLAQPGDNVLLSPACASFDMFKNYEDRGNAFIECVKAVSV